MKEKSLESSTKKGNESQKIVKPTDNESRREIRICRACGLQKGKSRKSSDEHTVPTLPHTDNAFRVGEVVFLHLQKKIGDKTKWIDRAAHIIEVLPKDIRISIGEKTYTLPKQFHKIKCTDTWRRIFDALNQGDVGNKQLIRSGDVTFDYRIVDGEDSIVVTLRKKMRNPITFRYRYDDVRRELHTASKLRAIPMETHTEEENTGLWLRSRKTIPTKSNNPIDGAVNISRDWVVFKKTSASFSGSVFNGWNINKADEICAKCPWLSKRPATWIDDSTGKKVVKKTIPSRFKD